MNIHSNLTKPLHSTWNITLAVVERKTKHILCPRGQPPQRDNQYPKQSCRSLHLPWVISVKGDKHGAEIARDVTIVEKCPENQILPKPVFSRAPILKRLCNKD